MTNWERFVSQATSGRWLLTVTAGLCLFSMTLADCWYVYAGKFTTSGSLPFSVEALLAIITAVFMAYFGKAPTPTNGDSNGNGNGAPTLPPPPPQP